MGLFYSNVSFSWKLNRSDRFVSVFLRSRAMLYLNNCKMQYKRAVNYLCYELRFINAHKTDHCNLIQQSFYYLFFSFSSFCGDFQQGRPDGRRPAIGDRLQEFRFETSGSHHMVSRWGQDRRGDGVGEFFIQH